MQEYLVRRARVYVPPTGDWEGPAWSEAEALTIGHFRPESGPHRPRATAKVVYDRSAVHVLFKVEDRYVRCVQTAYMAPVHTDSCVEFFVRPKPRGGKHEGYFNFEVNCGGTLLCSYVEDWTRTPTGFEKCTRLPARLGRKVRVFHTMPRVVDPEIQGPVEWRVQLAVPFSILETYVGPLGDVAGRAASSGQRCGPDRAASSGQRCGPDRAASSGQGCGPDRAWRANFYKCGDDTSHPHWAAWSPVDELNFHLPDCFGVIRFEG